MTANGEPYLQRINRVIDYLREHAAADPSLDELARIAGLSRFHFHRIFTAVTGETVHAFMVRTRLERAATLMQAMPRATVTRVAFECGYRSLAEFSRAFKQRYGVSPGRWDRSAGTPLAHNRQTDNSPRSQTLTELAVVGRSREFSVRTWTVPARRVAWLRIGNRFAPGRVLEGYRTLIGWLNRRFGALPDGTLIGMPQDDPEVTPAEQCRYDFCYTVPDGTDGSGEIGVRTLPACTVAGVPIRGDIGKLTRGWDYLYRYWLPRSRYVPLNLPAMEIYRRTPEETGWREFDLEGCIPVEAFPS
ncbi:MAG: GyrI-like domain-containing protein [Gemmatimonadales bacterium]